MKLIKTDKSDGYAKIRIENTDDLWHLKDIIGPGDRLRAVTQRTKLDGREKKTVTLTIRAEKTEYTEDRLRVTGEIVEGAEDIEMGYHTFNLDEDTEFEIRKDFTEEEWNRLIEAESKHAYKVLFCLVEKGSADLFVVEESGIKDLSKVSENIPGKMYDDQKTGEDFHKDLKRVLERSAEKVDKLVLGGPGHEKNKVKNLLSDEVRSKTFLIDTSVTGRTGLHEAIKRGALDKVVEESRISKETTAVERFLEELRKDSDVSYGDDVEELAEIGAVEELIITQEMFRENPDIAKNVERSGGDVTIVHTDHEAGERLDNFGGMAALLRYTP